MTVRKLSDSDKRDILNLYRQAGETTSTLADRYGVSNSTISRLLKSTLPEDEYETLIASKRAARTYYPGATQTLLFNEPPEVTEAQPQFADSEEVSVTQPQLADSEEVSVTQPQLANSELEEIPTRVEAQLNLARRKSEMTSNRDLGGELENSPQLLEPLPLDIAAPSQSLLDEEQGTQANVIAQMLGEDLLDESEELADLDDEDLDEDDLDEDDLEQEMPIVRRLQSSQALVQVLPLSEANLPKTCYLVIDRASELITRPLRDFGDLGQIPSQEVQQRTLPVFDNHRVARRFSTKRDRVIKVPDSRMLQKTHSQLQAKGITRLLVDGQVYSLSPTLP